MTEDLSQDATAGTVRAKENRKLLMSVDNGLDSRDLEMLIFLFRDRLNASKIEKIETGLDLFTELEKNNIIGEKNDQLAEALFRIHRIDLLKRLAYDPKKVQKHLKRNVSQLSPFRVILFQVSEDISSEDFKTMKFLLSDKIPRGKHEKLKSVLDLFNFLETDGQIAHDDPDILLQVLDETGRPDLSKMIRETYLTEPEPEPEPGSLENVMNSSSGFQPPPDQTFVATGPMRQDLTSTSTQNQNCPVEKMEVNADLNIPQPTVPLETHQNQGKITALTDPILQQLGVDLCEGFEVLARALNFSEEEISRLASWKFPHSGYRLFELLKNWRDVKQCGKSEEENLLALSSVLDKIGYRQLSQLLCNKELYEQTPTSQLKETQVLYGSGPAQSEEKMEISETSNVVPVKSTKPQVQSEENVSKHENIAVSVTEAQPQLSKEEEGNQQQNLNRVNSVPQIVEIPGQTASILSEVVHIPVDDLPCYKMDSRPRGYCVIINNKEFIPDEREDIPMPIRNGTEIDRDNLQWIFDKMGFIVKVYNNLPDYEMVRAIVDVSHNVNHDEYDCFVCCILSHGILGHVYGSNGRLVRIEELTSVFRSQKCHSLAGKPKLFFIQACQGREKQEGVEVYEADSAIETDNPPTRTLIPDESDFLLGYATVPGYVSYRSRSHGSWYIQKLVEMLDKFHQKYDLMSIMVKVNEEVSRANANLGGGLYKQTPAPQVTLRKKIYFQ